MKENTIRTRAPKKGEPGYNEYFKAKTLKRVLKVIKDNPTKVYTAQDAYITAKINRSQFYRLFPQDSEELDAIKDALNENRFIITKSAVSGLMRKEETTAYIAIIKMYGSEEERAALSHQDVKISGNREQPLTMEISMPELKVAKRERKE